MRAHWQGVPQATTQNPGSCLRPQVEVGKFLLVFLWGHWHSKRVDHFWTIFVSGDLRGISSGIDGPGRRFAQTPLWLGPDHACASGSFEGPCHHDPPAETSRRGEAADGPMALHRSRGKRPIRTAPGPNSRPHWQARAAWTPSCIDPAVRSIAA